MLGLGTYAFAWQHAVGDEGPMTLRGALESTREQGVELFQICDFEPLNEMSAADVLDAAAAAKDLGLSIELGTKGLEPERLDRFLHLAEQFDASLVRTMLTGPSGTPTLAEAAAILAKVLPAYEAAGVSLVLETYEQVATSDLVSLVSSLSSSSIGICLDPANVVARLETPAQCIDTAADFVLNIHAKDFAFSRRPNWAGFSYGGAPMGTGLHDYAFLLETVRPRERGINEIVEHWLPWQGDAKATVRTEREWTRTALEYLRSME